MEVWLVRSGVLWFCCAFINTKFVSRFSQWSSFFHRFKGYGRTDCSDDGDSEAVFSPSVILLEGADVDGVLSFFSVTSLLTCPDVGGQFVSSVEISSQPSLHVSQSDSLSSVPPVAQVALLSIGVLPFAFSPAVWPCKDYLYHSPTSYVDSKGGGMWLLLPEHSFVKGFESIDMYALRHICIIFYIYCFI